MKELMAGFFFFLWVVFCQLKVYKAKYRKSIYKYGLQYAPKPFLPPFYDSV